MKRLWKWRIAGLTVILWSSSAVIGWADSGSMQRVGVVRPQITAENTGSSRPLTERRMPARVRAALAAAATAASESPQTWKDTLRDQLPLTVQGAWVDLLARERIAAVPLAAATLEAANKEAESQNVGWFLTSSVRAISHMEPAITPTKAGELFGQKVSRTMVVTYSLIDHTGRMLIPERQASCSAVLDLASLSSRMESGPDLWTDCGQQVVKAAAMGLPLSGVAKVDSTDLVPKAPPMANSVRLDMTVSEQNTFKTGRYQGSVPASSGATSAIFEMAEGCVTTQQRGMGFILMPSTSRAYGVSDKTHQYFTMSSLDMQMMSKVQTSMQSNEEAGRLTQTGVNGNTREYSYTAPLTHAPSSVTTVSIEFGPPLDAWRRGIETLKQTFGPFVSSPVSFGTDPSLAPAVWQAILESDAPPRRILVHTKAQTQYGKKNFESENFSEIIVKSDQLARPVDFEVPADYRLRSNPYLEMIWLL